ncbi:two-component response regulator 24 [Argentina anserina]|uniref:two-component response regulator 24 n=1 Tax=Argentina anserina TaxID=57926 RepID=UPI0021766D5E|nr:two-component response regulator 24 [Potentilla anserina]
MAGEKKIYALIVEDDRVTQMRHQMLLNRFNCEIQVAGNGKEAVDLYRLGASTFDVVLMDMEMPVMDGLEATRELRAMGFKGLIVGVTSRELEFAKPVFKEAGADDCYEKPLTAEHVTSILEEIGSH